MVRKEMCWIAIRENGLQADVIYACGPTPMLRALKEYAEENQHRVLAFTGGKDGLRYRCLSGLRMSVKRGG